MKSTLLSFLFILSVLFGRAQSDAGSDTTHLYCPLDVFSLWDGLATSISTNGTWYGPFYSSVPNEDSIQITIPGQYNYYYVVSSPGFPSDTSIHVMVVSECPDWNGASVKEEDDYDIKVFPNPSTGIVEVKSVAVISNLEVYSMDGKQIISSIVKSEYQQHYSIDLSEVENGIYYLMFTINSDVVRKKIEIK